MEMKLIKNNAGDRIFIATGKDEEFKCSKCFKQIDIGFVCEDNNKIILCVKCQEDFKMERCGYDKRGEHKHIKFTHDNTYKI